MVMHFLDFDFDNNDVKLVDIFLFLAPECTLTVGSRVAKLDFRFFGNAAFHTREIPACLFSVIH